MANQPFFSIIIPALNEEKFLPKLLEDLKRQTLKDFEVIVVDGGSKDETVKRARAFNNGMKVIIIKSDEQNVAYQRNLGAKEAKGKWFLFLDADDRLPEFFLDGVKYRVHHKKADMFTTYCDVDSDNPADKLIAQYMNTSIEVSLTLEKPMAWGSMIGVTREGFSKIGGFDEHTKVFEDKKFVGEGYERGLRFKIFKDPTYIFSIRRFKSKGRLKTFQKYMELSLKSFTNTKIDQEKEYPMGGQAFKKERKRGFIGRLFGK